MFQPWGLGRRSRRFVHDNGIQLFVVAIVIGVIALVALLMYLVSS